MEELWQRLYEEPVTVEKPKTEEITERATDSPEPMTDMEKRVLMGMQRIRSICSEIFQKLKER